MKASRVLWFSVTIGLAFLSGYGFRGAFAQQNSAAERSAEKLPPDLHPDTRSRLPWPTRDQFTSDDEKRAFDHVVQLAPRYFEKPTTGPTTTMMHLPIVGEAYLTARDWLREKSGLEQRYVHLAILISARESSDQFQWLEHERSSVNVLPRSSVEVVRNRKDTAGLAEKDAALIQYGREMYQQPRVSAKTFAEMERLFGRRATLAATLLMAHYTLHALMLHAYDQHLVSGDTSPFTTP